MSYKKRNRATRSARYAVCSYRGLGTYTLDGMRPRNGCQRRRRAPSASRWPVCLQLLVKVLHGSPSRLGAMVGLRDPTNRPKYLFCHKNEVTYAPRRPECRPRAPRVGPPGKHCECRRPLELSLKGPGFFRKKKRRPGSRLCCTRVQPYQIWTAVGRGQRRREDVLRLGRRRIHIFPHHLPGTDATIVAASCRCAHVLANASRHGYG